MENSANQLGSASKQSIKVKAEKTDVLTHVFASQVLEESAKRRRQRLSKVCDRTIVAKGDGKQTYVSPNLKFAGRGKGRNVALSVDPRILGRAKRRSVFRLGMDERKVFGTLVARGSVSFALFPLVFILREAKRTSGR